MSTTPPAGWRGALARRLGVHRRRDWVLLIALIALSGYLAYALLYQGWTYLALKTSVKAAPAQLRVARWRDPSLACPGKPRLGEQFDRLFERGYEAFVTRILWDALPPRYEMFIAGAAAPKRGFELRYLVMTVDLESGDRAVLRDAAIAGENGHLETAKQWLAAACSK
jgi:hypothetical protein